jgi:hypothetical protein
MRVRIKTELDYTDLRGGHKEIPAGKYSVIPLDVGTAVGGTQTVAYRLDNKKSYATYRIDVETFEAWKKEKKITEL